MKKQYLTVSCPFCKEGQIDVHYFPSTTKSVKGPYGGSRGAIERSAEKLIVVTDKCPKCGKSDKDIEKMLNKDEPKISHEERIKKIKESGLPTRIDF